MQKPELTEYNPYFQHYIDLAGEGNFLDLLKENTVQAESFFKNIRQEKHNFRYAPAKWTIKEVLMHLIDTERVFSYRVLVCSRGDSSTPLHSMDDKLYASHVDVTNRPMHSLAEEFLAVRKNTEFLYKHMSDAQSQFIGNGVTHNITSRALAFIIIGHIQHHINVVKERYL